MDVVHSSKRRLIRVCSSLRGQGDRLVVAIRHCSREYSPPRRAGNFFSGLGRLFEPMMRNGAFCSLSGMQVCPVSGTK